MNVREMKWLAHPLENSKLIFLKYDMALLERQKGKFFQKSNLSINFYIIMRSFFQVGTPFSCYNLLNAYWWK